MVTYSLFTYEKVSCFIGFLISKCNVLRIKFAIKRYRQLDFRRKIVQFKLLFTKQLIVNVFKTFCKLQSWLKQKYVYWLTWLNKFVLLMSSYSFLIIITWSYLARIKTSSKLFFVLLFFFMTCHKYLTTCKFN